MAGSSPRRACCSSRSTRGRSGGLGNIKLPVKLESRDGFAKFDVARGTGPGTPLAEARFRIAKLGPAVKAAAGAAVGPVVLYLAACAAAYVLVKATGVGAAAEVPAVPELVGFLLPGAVRARPRAARCRGRGPGRRRRSRPRRGARSAARGTVDVVPRRRVRPLPDEGGMSRGRPRARLAARPCRR